MQPEVGAALDEQEVGVGRSGSLRVGFAGGLRAGFGAGLGGGFGGGLRAWAGGEQDQDGGGAAAVGGGLGQRVDLHLAGRVSQVAQPAWYWRLGSAGFPLSWPSRLTRTDRT